MVRKTHILRESQGKASAKYNACGDSKRTRHRATEQEGDGDSWYQRLVPLSTVGTFSR